MSRRNHPDAGVRLAGLALVVTGLIGLGALITHHPDIPNPHNHPNAEENAR